MAPGAPPVVLASGSAARRALMQAAGLIFTAEAVGVDEAAIKSALRSQGVDAAETALALADAKAACIPDPDALVIGSDQLLLCDADWFDKPPDLAAARAQLWRLRGRRHQLLTAVTCWRGGRSIWHHVARPVLVMRAFSEAFMDAYFTAEGESILASVGCYRLEGRGMQLFDAIEGEHDAILGLPMLPLLGFLRQHGVILT